MAYHIVICSIAGFYRWFQPLFCTLEQEYHLGHNAREPLYDWLVKEALAQLLGVKYQAEVYDHWRHDIYKCIFDSVGPAIKAALETELTSHAVVINKGEVVKVLVAGDSLFIARGDGWSRT